MSLNHLAITILNLDWISYIFDSKTNLLRKDFNNYQRIILQHIVRAGYNTF